MGTQQDDTGATMKRRGLIAGAAALVAGIAATRTSQSVSAAPIAGDSTSAGIPGVRGTNSAAGGTGVSGDADAAGVQGSAHGAASKGVDGSSNGGSGIGVNGFSNGGSGIGVRGTAAGGAGIGVQGVIPNTSTFSNMFAVQGTNQSTGAGGRGMYALINGGTAIGTIGIYGANVTNAADAHGIIGLSQSGHGLVGVSNASGPLYAGLVGNAGPNGASAGNFYGNVAVTGNLYVGGNQTVAGAKSAALAHPDGSHRLVYCVEAPESWLEDVGTGMLTNGTAQIKLDPDFAAVAEMSDYHVFITEGGDFHTHVTGKQAGGFVVQQTTGTGKANGNGPFSWRVMAKRKDVKAGRLAKVDLPKLTPPTIPPPNVPDLPTPPAPPKKP